MVNIIIIIFEEYVIIPMVRRLHYLTYKYISRLGKRHILGGSDYLLKTQDSAKW